MKVQSSLYPQMKFQLCVMLFSYSIDPKKQWPSAFATCVHGPKVNVYHDNSRAQRPRTHSNNGRKYTKAHKIVLAGRDLPDLEGGESVLDLSEELAYLAIHPQPLQPNPFHENFIKHTHTRIHTQILCKQSTGHSSRGSLQP